MTGADKLNLRAHAVLDADKSLYVTLINNEHGENAQAATVTLAGGKNISQCEIISLSQSANDVAATNGVTLGGATITTDGNWAGAWKPIGGLKNGGVSVTVPSASAVIVKLKN
jgi:hypothetical protein